MNENMSERVVESDHIAAENDSLVENTETIVITKSQRKKAARLARMLENRKSKRQLERSRRKEKRLVMRASGIAPSIKKQINMMSNSKCSFRVAVDMAYEHLMNESSIRKTISQLNFCYAANRRAENPLQYYITNLRGQSKIIFDKIPGYSQWDAFILDDPLSQLWHKEEIVYLTSESDNVLQTIEENKTYVIGGLVDHNSHKGLCHSSAIAQGFSHARLPIDEFVKLKTRKVLTINHVFEILLRFSESKDWEDSFFNVIPKRKGMERLQGETPGSVVELEEVLQDSSNSSNTLTLESN